MDKGDRMILVCVGAFFGIAALISLLVSQGEPKEPNNEYYRSAEVFRIENEVVYLEDTQGYVWCVEGDTLQMFGRYVLVMDNCGTDDITDDEILRIEQKKLKKGLTNSAPYDIIKKS